jgi:hypothetical protein
VGASLLLRWKEVSRSFFCGDWDILDLESLILHLVKLNINGQPGRG